MWAGCILDEILLWGQVSLQGSPAVFNPSQGQGAGKNKLLTGFRQRSLNFIEDVVSSSRV